MIQCSGIMNQGKNIFIFSFSSDFVPISVVRNWQNKANVKAMNNFQKNVTVHGKCIILLSVCELNIKNIIK